MLEICCGSFEDAMIAHECGIQRIELNSALSLGGLTPSLGSLIMTKQYTDLEVASMVRARAAGFCYTDYQFEQMVEDMKLLLAYGTDAIVFGFLKEDQTIDERKTEEFVQCIHGEGRKAVFHRAFDCVKDSHRAMEQLISLGVDRVLTSGQEETAEQGIPLLRELQESYGNKIELLAGGGVNETNAKKIMDETGITQIHSSCKGWGNDVTTVGEKVTYAVYDKDLEQSYEMADYEKIQKLISAVESSYSKNI